MMMSNGKSMTMTTTGEISGRSSDDEDSISFVSGDDDWGDELNSQAESEEKLPQSKDIKMINIVRSFVILLLLTIAAIFANGVFVYAFMQEEKEYNERLKQCSLDLIDNFYQKIASKLSAAQTLSTTFTSHIHSTGGQYPFVSIPDFSEQCSVPRQVSEVSTLTYMPLVTRANLVNWNAYASDFSFIATVNQGEDVVDEEEKFVLPHNRSIEDGIYRVTNGVAVTDQAGDMHFPIWQSTPLSRNASEVMFNHMSNPVREEALLGMFTTAGGSCSNFLLEDSGRTDYAFYSTPRSTMYYPLFEAIHSVDIVGSIALEFEWELLFAGVMEEEDAPLVVVLESSCGGNVSFEVSGADVSYMGEGAQYDSSVSAIEIQASEFILFADQLQQDSSPENRSSVCDFRFMVYPTEEFRQSFLTNTPLYLKLLVAASFIFTIGVFLIYDCVIDNYQKRMVESAAKTNAIVAALFPQNVRERLLGRSSRTGATSVTSSQQKSAKDDWTTDGSSKFHTPKFRLRNALRNSISATASVTSGGSGPNGEFGNDEPLADLYPHCTIFFSDIAGFTSWASERDPKCVFTLLETLYGAMDTAARRLGVFKVETIGDCYVAATGLPTARKDHAEVMVRFARACMAKCRHLLVSLEIKLGPGTADLGMRTGIHSGPVTAGILRGEKSRFQLFGDAMNTCSRIESLGQKHKIHMSEEVVRLLEEAGKGHWAIPREGLVHPKGKQALQTYWLRLTNASSATGSSITDESAAGHFGTSESERRLQVRPIRNDAVNASLEDPTLNRLLWQTSPSKKDELLIDWNTDVLCQLLADLNASRRADRSPKPSTEVEVPKHTTTPLDELVAVINMPAPSFKSLERMNSMTARPTISDLVQSEIRDYVRTVASTYPRHAFHNFEHASHVSLSASKLLKRIECADGVEQQDGITLNDLHSHTYGIASDSLTKFAVVFSALTHDAGHPGVANAQLVKEAPETAERYEKCHAEQVSVDLAWELLMLPRYENFRKQIFGNQLSEGRRFRQLLVNCVLATDIFDKDLCEFRKERWTKAFFGSDSLASTENVDRKATIVIEHIIQASDVSHTMQHWHIYKKWNERLFQEMYQAFVDGRQEKDPSQGWYKGEIWFFDNYIIPLAHKLKECGVFGASGDEYLTYAVQNRNEWVERGEDLCREMVDKTEEMFACDDRYFM